jgi:hypothetical protein
MGTGRELRLAVSVFLDAQMTFRRTLLALLFGAVGCAALPNVAGDDICATADANCTIIPPDASSDASYFGDVTGANDAGAPAPLSRASLCGGSCSPDDPKACLVTDGGVGDAGLEACRVVLGVNQKTDTDCAKSGQGTEGASCTSGGDCAPGYECVGTGTCRRYCCDESTCGALSTSYETYFCDVAQEHASSGAVVPVCNAVTKCQLFTDSCAMGEACTIVEIDNTTIDAGTTTNYVATCDTLGDAKINDSCETQHCGLGLACIGPIGSRTCQELCDSQHPCPQSLSCKTSSQALAQFKVGVCQM